MSNEDQDDSDDMTEEEQEESRRMIRYYAEQKVPEMPCHICKEVMEAEEGADLIESMIYQLNDMDELPDDLLETLVVVMTCSSCTEECLCEYCNHHEDTDA